LFSPILITLTKSFESVHEITTGVRFPVLLTAFIEWCFARLLNQFGYVENHLVACIHLQPIRQHEQTKRACRSN
jgi:hypothetical protein